VKVRHADWDERGGIDVGPERQEGISLKRTDSISLCVGVDGNVESGSGMSRSAVCKAESSVLLGLLCS